MQELEEIYGKEYALMLGGGTTEAEKAPGFVIVVEGYSPYKEIGALLDPPNVKDDPSRWGLVTRLENLKQFLNLDVNSPFEVYSKNPPHFKIETGPVDVDSESLPMGVGSWKFIPSAAAVAAAAANPMGMTTESMDGTWILIDPVTKETISAEAVLDQYGKPKLDFLYKPIKQNRDYWFKLQVKLKWKEAPATPEGVGMTKGRR